MVTPSVTNKVKLFARSTKRLAVLTGEFRGRIERQAEELLRELNVNGEDGLQTATRLVQAYTEITSEVKRKIRNDRGRGSGYGASGHFLMPLQASRRSLCRAAAAGTNSAVRLLLLAQRLVANRKVKKRSHDNSS